MPGMFAGKPARGGPRRARSRASFGLLGLVVGGMIAGREAAAQVPRLEAAPPWGVKVDPPAETFKVPEEAGYSLAVPSGQGVLFPTTYSPFVALGQNKNPTDSRQVFDLRTKSAAGAIRGKGEVSEEAKISPDGRYFLTELKGGPPAKTVSIVVWSFKTGQAVRTIEASPSLVFLKLLGFGKGNMPVTARYVGQGDVVSAWDVETGKLVSEMLAPPSFAKEGVAISPGGRYLALISNEPHLVVFDLTNGRKVGELPIPNPGHPEGLTFSPDGTELAGVFAPGTDTKVLVWDVAKGEVVVDHTIKGMVKLNTPGGQNTPGHTVEWLPDGSAWLLYGHTLVDRANGRIVWTFRPAEGDFSPGPRVLLDADRMLATVGPPDARRLQVIPLPWAKIDAALKAIEAKAPAHVRAGEAVSLKVEVGKVRFGTPEGTRAEILKALTERLEAEGIEVAEGRPTVLHARYTEAAGETLQVVRSNGPLPGFGGGTPTGQTVQATKAACDLTWEVAGGKKTLWADHMDFDPRNLMVRGEASDAKAREAVFGMIRGGLTGRLLPYFIPKDAALATLPGVTVMPAAKDKRTNKATAKPTMRGKKAG